MKTKNWWGKAVSLDLHNCNKSMLNDPKAIKRYISKLVSIIKMQKHGQTYIKQFGTGELKGWSAMQFIKTSSIIIHCDDKGGRAFVDIFSCKDYSQKIASDFSKSFFEASKVRVRVVKRY